MIILSNNNLTYGAPIQSGSYSISLPNQQDYDILGTWGGRTIDVASPGGTGAIELESFDLNAAAGVTSITHDLPALNLNPTPPPITQTTPTPTPTPSAPEFSTWIILPLFAVIILISIVFVRKRGEPE